MDWQLLRGLEQRVAQTLWVAVSCMICSLEKAVVGSSMLPAPEVAPVTVPFPDPQVRTPVIGSVRIWFPVSHGFVSCLNVLKPDGEMCLWDLRVASPVSVVQATRPDMSCLAVHNFAPLIAAGSSDKRYIQIMDLHGEQIERLLYHSGFAGKTLGPIRCLDFHNTSMLLAAGTADHDVSVFEGTRPV
jgi:WD40 repeat protein